MPAACVERGERLRWRSRRFSPHVIEIDPPLGLEEHPYVTGAQPVTRSKLADGQVTLDPCKNVVLDRPEATDSNATTLGHLLGCSTRTDGHRGEIVHVHDCQFRKARGNDAVTRACSANISAKEP